MEPGWYRNPKDPDIIRFWDGSRWSETKRAPQSARSSSLPDGFHTSLSWGMRTAVVALVVACVAAAALIAATLLKSSDTNSESASTNLLPPRNFESASTTVFGPRRKVDTTELVGMPQALVLNNDQDISLGVGHNILNKPSTTPSGVASKAYWTNIFLSPDTSEVFLEALNKKISDLGYKGLVTESGDTKIVYLGKDLVGTSLKFSIEDSSVTSMIEVSYYDIEGDDTLVMTRSFPSDEFVDSSEINRGAAGSWAEELSRQTGWFLSGIALQPRMDSVEFSNSTHTATATFKVPAERYEKVMQSIKDGTSLSGFANLAPKQAFQDDKNSTTVFFRAGTRIEVSITRPDTDDTESTVVVFFDVQAP